MMKPLILEVPAGSDVVETISQFARSTNTSLIILSGSGTVTNVTISEPSFDSTHSATFFYDGRYDIHSLSATFSFPPKTSPRRPNGVFFISFTRSERQVFGGRVIGKLLAVSTVYVIAASFKSFQHHRLPLEEDLKDINGITAIDHHLVPSGAENGGGSRVSKEDVRINGHGHMNGYTIDGSMNGNVQARGGNSGHGHMNGKFRERGGNSGHGHMNGNVQARGGKGVPLASGGGEKPQTADGFFPVGTPFRFTAIDDLLKPSDAENGGGSKEDVRVNGHGSMNGNVRERGGNSGHGHMNGKVQEKGVTPASGGGEKLQSEDGFFPVGTPFSFSMPFDD